MLLSGHEQSYDPAAQTWPEKHKVPDSDTRDSWVRLVVDDTRHVLPARGHDLYFGYLGRRTLREQRRQGTIRTLTYREGVFHQASLRGCALDDRAGAITRTVTPLVK